MCARALVIPTKATLTTIAITATVISNWIVLNPSSLFCDSAFITFCRCLSSPVRRKVDYRTILAGLKSNGRAHVSNREIRLNCPEFRTLDPKLRYFT